jgi:hypothetical protein
LPHRLHRFMVHALEIAGWTLYSNASAAVSTPREDRIPPNAVRIEVGADLKKAPQKLIDTVASSAAGASPDGSQTAVPGSVPSSAALALGSRLGEEMARDMGSAIDSGGRLVFKWAYPIPPQTAILVMDILSAGGAEGAGGGMGGMGGVADEGPMAGAL